MTEILPWETPKGARFLRSASIWGWSLFAAFSIAVLGFLTFTQGMLETVASMPFWFVPAIAAFASVAFALRCCRWLFLARSLGVPARADELAEVYLGGFVMNLTPGRVGKLWRAWVLKQSWKVNYGQGTALVFCDRFMDLNVLLILAAMGTGFAAAFFWPAAIACAAFVMLVFFTLLPNWARFTLKGLWGLLGKPLPRLFAGTLGLLRNLRRILAWRNYLVALALSLLAWGTEVMAYVVLVPAAFGHALDPYAAAASLGLANIVGLISESPAGFAAQDVTLGFLLERAGLPFLVVAVTIACMRLGTLWYSVLLGLPFFLRLTHKYAAANNR